MFFFTLVLGDHQFSDFAERESNKAKKEESQDAARQSGSNWVVREQTREDGNRKGDEP